MKKTQNPMTPIPIEAGKQIAFNYGYDQVVILARRVGEGEGSGEHITTYGIDQTHCDVAAQMGDKLKNICGWPHDNRSRYIVENTDGEFVASFSTRLLADFFVEEGNGCYRHSVENLR